MPREITDGIHWIQGCYDSNALQTEFEADPPSWYEPGYEVHVTHNAYLVVGDETLLFDTLTPYGTERVLDELETALDGRSLDYLAVSHPENPHAGNTFPILREHPEAELIAPAFGGKHELYHLEDATLVDPGDTIDLGGRVVEFVEPTILDHRMHMWMVEHATETLFTVDWLGDIHSGEHCYNYLDEVADDDLLHRRFEFDSRALFWYRFGDLEKMQAAIEQTITLYRPSLVAPAHGLPIREDVEESMRQSLDVIEHITQSGHVTKTLS